MKDYDVLKKNDNVKLESAEDENIRVLKANFDGVTGEKTFNEAMITNSQHQRDVIRDLKAHKKRVADQYKSEMADINSRLAGAKALQADLKKFNQGE